MDDIRIIEAKPEDAERLFELVWSIKQEKGLFIVPDGLPDSTQEERAFLEFMTPDTHLMLLALDGEIAAGHLLANFGTFEMNRHTAELGIILGKGYRGQGIGTKLMLESFKLMRERGISKVTISVFEPNERGLVFYERLGFKREGLRQDQWFFEGKMINEVILAKML